MKTVSIRGARTQLARLVKEVETGGRIVIGRSGQPVAVLSRYEKRTAARRSGQWKGKVWIAPNFDAPLPSGIAAAFRGEMA